MQILRLCIISAKSGYSGEWVNFDIHLLTVEETSHQDFCLFDVCLENLIFIPIILK